MYFRWLLVTLLLPISVIAADTSHTHTADELTDGHPADHSIGIHGMALMLVDGRVFASHMPLHGGMHAHQIVLELEIVGEAAEQIISLLRKEPLVSLMPERLSLNKLRAGSLNQFNGGVYAGHFERGGVLLFRDVGFRVKRRLLDQALESLPNGWFYTLAVGKQVYLLIHRIGQLPSMDQFVLVQSDSAELPALLYLGETPLSEDAPILKVAGLTWLAQLYLETVDFAVH